VNTFLRRIRLLPLVIVVGISLLTVKGFGIFEALAEGAGDAEPSEQSEAMPSTAADDPADDESETVSASEVDVLTSLTKRRKQLDEREQKIAMRENVITAATQRIDTRINELKALEAEIQKLLGQRDAEEQKQIASLVKTYSAMKPKDAARIFDTLDPDVRIAVAQLMKSDVLAPILAAMQATEAQKITVALANRMKVTTPPPAPVAPPAAPAAENTQPPAPGITPPGSTTPTPTAANTTPPATTPPEAAPKTPEQKTAEDTTPKTTPIHTPRPRRPKPAQTAAVHAPATTPPAQTAANTPKPTTPAPAPVQTAATKPTTPAAQPAAAPATAPAQAPAAAPGAAAQKPGG
jgi:flagellar motility protein MotE (MotC chaperone)